jgi:hypothetical protein
MAKKNKKKPTQQQFLSPENYIRTKARNLPIAECFITPNWQEVGEANVIVARKHTNGNYTIGVYLIDLYCLGVKNAYYFFNIDESKYKDIVEHKSSDFQPITYNEVHNLIYGALAYAEDLGFNPHKDFGVAQYILEEDTDEIPLIEYEFGKDGEPLLIAKTQAELNKYLPTLKKAVGEDAKFIVAIDDDFDDDDEYDDDDEFDEDDDDVFWTKDSDKELDILDKFLNPTPEMEENIKRFTKMMRKSDSLPTTVYAYEYPEYPKTLELTHKELEVIFLPENNIRLSDETINKILALPRESLIADLNHCILYEIGRNCREISEENIEKDLYGSLTHALFLLAELEAEESLQTALEVLRQSRDFEEFFFGDFLGDIIISVIYKLGHNQLPALLDFIKEPNLSGTLKYEVSPAVEFILHYQPERRAEIIKWYDEVLDFLYENINNTAYFDSHFTALIMCDLVGICAKELLPQIKRLFDTGLVNDMICGNYGDIEEDINKGETRFYRELKSIYDIYELFERYKN